MIEEIGWIRMTTKDRHRYLVLALMAVVGILLIML